MGRRGGGPRSPVRRWRAAHRHAYRTLCTVALDAVAASPLAAAAVARCAGAGDTAGVLFGSVLRLNYYHPEEREAVVCPEHADMSLVSLATADVPGFETWSAEGGRWEACDEVTRVVAFPGKLLWMLGGGGAALLPKYHRVSASPGAPPRLSVTLFLRLAPAAAVPDPRAPAPPAQIAAVELQHAMNDVPAAWRVELRSRCGAAAFDAMARRTERYLSGGVLPPHDPAFAPPRCGDQSACAAHGDATPPAPPPPRCRCALSAVLLIAAAAGAAAAARRRDA